MLNLLDNNITTIIPGFIAKIDELAEIKFTRRACAMWAYPETSPSCFRQQGSDI
jgi:hypothetical protein